MTEVELQTKLHELISRWESECVEFKEATDNYPTPEIGKYFSALSNEAALHQQARGWLVFGVRNKDRSVVGTTYRPDHARLDSLKHQISQNTGGPTFREIHELTVHGQRVLLFEIPAAVQGAPVAWNRHFYARDGESIVGMALDKLDELRRPQEVDDWSAVVIPPASLADLDPVALKRARVQFTLRHSNNADEINSWSDAVFLNRARLTADGGITRAALLLLGKAESTHHLTPHPAQITWRLEGAERAYEHFSPPFLLTTTEVFRRIRNLTVKFLPPSQLLPVEQMKYDQKVVLEALHNCLAHQDYTRYERVVVIETTDRLVFENGGNFFEGTPDDYQISERTPRRYRNPFLVHAMASLGMVDRMGYGLHDNFLRQRQRYFPLPDFDLTQAGTVRYVLHGQLLDENYSRLLLTLSDLPLAQIVALDRIQKGETPDLSALKELRQAQLVSGNRPRLIINDHALIQAAHRAAYVRNRAQDFEHYRKLVLDYLRLYPGSSRKELNELLLPKLPEALNASQRSDYVHNLLGKLKSAGLVRVEGFKRGARWFWVPEDSRPSET